MLNMKEISIYIPTHDLAQVTEILEKHNVGGITFYEISGAGKTKRDAIPEMVESYMTGRTVTPEYAKRTKVETIVSDADMDKIVDDLINSIGQHAGEEAHGMIFTKDVSNAYEIGTKKRGEAALSSK